MKPHQTAPQERDKGNDRRRQAIDSLAIAMLTTRPDLKQMSLDEWLIAHDADLSDAEKKATIAIIELHDELLG